MRSGVQNLLDSFERQAMLGSNLAHSRPWDKGAMNWGAGFGTLILNDVERKDMWEKCELSKQRNQWEYNEWYKAGALLDKALVTCDIAYIHLARQVITKRAYMMKVVDKDG
ncbi:33889_t:CDS:1 [Racocetra persica]|uniref:33889_t:CDS:1 n=1 Tax=Racocetra persica TaxID=160502 RepID=A0ACA9SFC9_9GLOM|nr:33889_t:CDS:1 [Racocetra persica]